MWLRLSQHGPIAAIATTVVDYRQHGNNLTRRYRDNVANQQRLRAQAARRLPPEDARIIAGAWRLLGVSGVTYYVGRCKRALHTRRWRQAIVACIIGCCHASRLVALHPPQPHGLFRLVVRWQEWLEQASP
jgi:hypothetical protein